MSYWFNEGKYEEEAEQLQNLVPMSGKAHTVKGEIWRAATKIYYDYFNNGFGNYWMKPAAFLMSKVELPPRVKTTLFDHANGNYTRIHYEDEMDLMIDTVIEALREMEDAPNDQDMWEYEVPRNLKNQFEEEFFEEDEEEDEEYDY